MCVTQILNIKFSLKNIFHIFNTYLFSHCLQHDEDKRKLYERERTVLEKRYTLPDSSHIIVHPSRMAKSGKFDCTVMSLSVLLDYRPEDTKVSYTVYCYT